MSTESWVRNRWLHAFFGATMALTAVIAAFGWSPWSSRWPAYAMIAILVLAYVAYGHRGYSEPKAAAVFLPLVVVSAAVLPAIAPSTAFVQCIVFPLIWVQTERIRTGVLFSIAVGVASSIGLQVSGGPDALVSTLVIEGISIIGACAMGIWISSIADLSESRRELLDELRATQTSLAQANRNAGIASERERLAREIHDTVAQNLAGIVMLTERAQSDLASHRIDALQDRLVVLEESARAALEESRALVAAGAAGVTRDSLGGALHRLGERHTRETGTTVTVDASECALDRDAQVVLLRVAQEALSNVRTHARATAVHVELRHEAEQTTLRITDDGVGFDTGVSSAGHGLRGLRERLALAGGSCRITSGPGRGTVVTATLPTGAAPSLPSAPVLSSVPASAERSVAGVAR
ncbi:sensor histidine kinase [Curtobacterium sp. VKM Ac-2922]|uniref:sensor histidine kinase n=1 Tax=Curtobacterium sp. VKM Ac-2922 TaxID=2929475 RepID=UPI001FB2D094|nr:sensor histidine kinase [Curtobacterium sp. VKM Ac-2922]MCJ1715424.1 sensor histidine kinase [Curtobacterium sp. VKM Ac-2922]